MKMIITGGAGFIGSNFVQYMVGKYNTYDIVNVDLLNCVENLKNLMPIADRPNYKFVKGDISNRSFIHNLFKTERPDMVVHFAEENRPSRYIANPEAFVRTNEVGTITLLDACRAFGIKHYHQVSTAEVYRDASDPYTASKASADLYVQAYYQTFGLPVTISRCSKNYGPCEDKEKFIPKSIKCALADKEIRIYGTGENVHDWLHVSDHCRAIDLIINKGRAGEIYNISGHNEQTDIMAVRTILRAMGKPEKLIRFAAGRQIHNRFFKLKSEKLKKELGWAVSYDFEAGIRQTIKWYRNHWGGELQLDNKV